MGTFEEKWVGTPMTYGVAFARAPTFSSSRRVD